MTSAIKKRRSSMRTFLTSLAASLACALMVFSSSAALAGLVATASIGTAIPSVEQGGVQFDGDAGFNLGASLGIRIGDMIQWDAIEVNYMSSDQVDNLFGNYTAKDTTIGTGVRVGLFGGNSRFHPYASIGIGGTRIDVVDQWGFEWNVGGGILFDLTDSLAVGVRYRYRGAKIDSSGISGSDLDVNTQTVAFEVVFGG